MQTVLFFTFDAKQSIFIAVDKNFKQMKMQKLMSSLASELLKDQIMTLEIEQGIMQKGHPIVILDTNCYLFQLKQVKNLIQSQTSIILVTLSVLTQLDLLKKGNEPVNIQAREANRYLEQRFKYPSPFLVGQKPNEESQPVESVFIPSSYRGIVSCALYYSQKMKERVAVITESDELRGIGESLGMIIYPLGAYIQMKGRLS